MNKMLEKLFFVSYGIYLAFCILNASFYASYINSYQKVIMILCVIIIIFRELMKKKIMKKDIKLLFMCAILFFILFLHINGLAMFPLFFYIYSARDIDLKKITKFTAIESSILLIFIIISALMGIITNYQIVQVLFGVTRTRAYLGFRYPLFPQMILFNISLCYLYWHKDKISVIRCIILIVLNYWMFTYTNARLSCYMAIMAIVAIYFLQKFPNFLEKKKCISCILIVLFPLCFFVSIYTTLNYDYYNPVMNELNQFLGGRLDLGKNSLSEYKINLFGQDTNYIGAGLEISGERTVGTYNYVDCLYINMLEKYGIIFNIMFFALVTVVMYKIWKDKNYVLLIIMSVLAIHGIIDDLEINLYYNVFWLAIGSYCGKVNKNEKIEKIGNIENIENI